MLKIHQAKRIRLFLPICAIFLISSGLFLLCILPWITELIARYQLEFKPGKEAYESWIVNKMPVYQDYYFFNCTNVNEVWHQGKKPVYEELGPYRFLQYKRFRNITHNEGNETVTFWYTKTYHYVKEEKTRDWSDRIYNFNPLAVIIANKAKYMGYFARVAVSLALSNTSPLFVNKTVEELLFKGYEDKLLNMINSIPFIDKSGLPDRFGWEYKKNDTDHIVGPFNSHSALDDDFGRILSYNYQANSSKFPGRCGDIRGIRGSLGEMNRMNMDKDVLNVYTTDLCTYLKLPFEQEETVKGVMGYRFATDKKSFFDNGLINVDNKCYCNGNCVPRGLLNISTCWQDAPVFASLPHFYQADSYYRHLVGGMKPDPKKHDLFLTVEPNSGKLVNVGVRLQINLMIENIKGIRMFSGLPTIFVPIVYINQEIQVPDSEIFKIQLVQLPAKIRYILGYPLLLAGVCLISAVFVLNFCVKREELAKVAQGCYDRNQDTSDEIKPLNNNDVLE